MKVKVFEDDFVSLSYEKSTKTCEELWNTNSGKMTAEQWKASRFEMVKLFSRYSPTRLLSQTQDLRFPITPELQDWLAKNVSVKIGGGIEKIAIVTTSEFITQLSVEQLMEEKETGTLNTQFFESYTTAYQWINK